MPTRRGGSACCSPRSPSILGQLGDLAESAIKRRFRVKDSGDIIPGHGGLMDRLDSITFGVIFAVCWSARCMAGSARSPRASSTGEPCACRGASQS